MRFTIQLFRENQTFRCRKVYLLCMDEERCNQMLYDLVQIEILLLQGLSNLKYVQISVHRCTMSDILLPTQVMCHILGLVFTFHMCEQSYTIPGIMT